MARPDEKPQDSTTDSVEFKDLPTKQAADASKVKGGFQPVDGKLPPRPAGPVDGSRLT